jgi:hypothetical protein
METDRIIHAVITATLLRPDLITGDAVNAMAGGHGMLNIAVFSAANAIADQLRRGRSLKVTTANQEVIDIDEILVAGIKGAIQGGADPSNAALISAVLCYFAGANARAGVPSGNRKLGALARLKAGVQRGGVQSLPTPKHNNRISGFPAVFAIYKAIQERKLTQVDGVDVPSGVGGTPLTGHSALGEDYIFPEIAENAARIGALAMVDAYRGVGMRPNPMISAIFGTAAALEIVHPEAVMPERFGASFEVHTSDVAGLSAAKAAGLPEELHFRGTGERFDTGKLIGDLGMIFKDIGSPTVVGMIAFAEMMASFEESAKIGAGVSGGPRNGPLGHLAADACLALRVLSKNGSIENAAKAIARNKQNFMDPVYAHIAANTVARKVEEVRGGNVSKAVLLATSCVTRKAIVERVQETINALDNGKKLTDVIQSFEEKRIETVQRASSGMMSKNLDRKIEIKIDKITGGARRSGKPGKKYYVLDPDIDVSLKIDGEEIVLNGLAHKIIPNAVLMKDKKMSELLPIVTPPVLELLTTGHTLIDLIVPTATAAVLGKGSPEELAEEAVARGSIATGGMPRCKEKALETSHLALACYELEISL